PGPDSEPIDCGHGLCCPSGTACSAAGCAVPPAQPLGCPPDAPVDCGNEFCCPLGSRCQEGRCLTGPDARPSEPICTDPGTVDAATDTNHLDYYGRPQPAVHLCCPAPSVGQTAFAQFDFFRSTGCGGDQPICMYGGS